ncbi:MAG: peroxiredoxin [bacterium]|nr:peroxiredoxin [bacterium]
MKLKENSKAPKFSSVDEDGNKVSLADFKGNWLVLYSYPKDNTSGCTIEAIDFTKLMPKFSKLGAKVVGISKDSCASHKDFIRGKKLKVTLLADETMEVQKAFGVWRMKKFMGREFLGTVRSTFLINPEGKIAKIWDDVKAEGHAKEVLATLSEIV